MSLFDNKAYSKSRSKRSRLIFQEDNVKIFENIKKNSSKISLILINDKNNEARFISALDFAERVASFTRNQNYSMNDLKNGFQPPVGGIVSSF